ncbi:MAG: hypothetical protein M3396_08310 [Actinomycetota bacterium]|nr:hypothetical protein [Actinomycetota bacterium]
MSLPDTARRSPALLWTAALVGILAWMVHITFASGIIDFTCNKPGSLWTVHAATAATGAITAAGMWICYGVMKRTGDDESSGTLAGNHSFVGVFGFITGAFSLALILLEGSFALFLSPCA